MVYPRRAQGELEKIRVWFQDYKVPDGKPQNKFGLGNKAADKVLADGLVESFERVHVKWKSHLCRSHAQSRAMLLVTVALIGIVTR